MGDLISVYIAHAGPEEDVTVLTSSRDGIQKQEDHFGRLQQHDTSDWNLIPYGYCTYRNRSDDGLFTFNVNKVADRGIVSKFYPVFETPECDADFLVAYLNSSQEIRKKLFVLAVGTSQVVLSYGALKELSLLLPQNREQSAIANVLNHIDNLITLHQRKRKYRGLYGYLSWEQRKFSELATLRRGLTYSPANIRPYGQGVRVLRSSNIAEDEFVLSREDVFVDEDVVKMDLAQDDEILITAANGSPRLVGKRAKIHDLAGKTVHGGFMLCARAEQPDFVVALMGSQWYQRFLATGVAGGNGSIGNLDKEALENETALIPRTEEQRLIGAHFSRLDALITLHQ